MPISTRSTTSSRPPSVCSAIRCGSPARWPPRSRPTAPLGRRIDLRPVGCRSGVGRVQAWGSGSRTSRASKPAGPQDLPDLRTCGFQNLPDFSSSGRPRRVLRAGLWAKHTRAASSPSGKMPLSFSFRCNFRPIPMYIPELRCIPAYSGLFRRIRPYSGSSGLIP